MKLIGYELKKIIGVRYFIVSLIILLILNLALCVYTNGWLVSDSQDGMYDRFFEEYNANPDYYDEYYKKLIEQQNAWFTIRIMIALIKYHAQLQAMKIITI